MKDDLILDDIVAVEPGPSLNDICGMLLKKLFGDEILDDPNFTETPRRMANMYLDMFKPKDVICEIADSIMSKSFPSDYRGMVLLPDISTVSFCPHHMLPVEYKIVIGYIPQQGLRSKLVGASKPERLACTLAKTPILQETYTRDIALWIQRAIDPLGVAVIIKGNHSCMRIRGVKNPCSSMRTSEMFGAFKENPRTQAELFSLLNLKL